MKQSCPAENRRNFQVPIPFMDETLESPGPCGRHRRSNAFRLKYRGHTGTLRITVLVCPFSVSGKAGGKPASSPESTECMKRKQYGKKE
jgi:hypothetical protein